MIARRSFVGALAAVHWVAPSRVGAQPAGRIHRLGLLHPGTPTASDDLNAPTFLTTPLRELGYVEGQNLIVEKRYAHGMLDRLPGLARELADLPVDVIVSCRHILGGGGQGCEQDDPHRFSEQRRSGGGGGRAESCELPRQRHRSFDRPRGLAGGQAGKTIEN